MTTLFLVLTVQACGSDTLGTLQVTQVNCAMAQPGETELSGVGFCAVNLKALLDAYPALDVQEIVPVTTSGETRFLLVSYRGEQIDESKIARPELPKL